jgi:hypothetical protein
MQPFLFRPPPSPKFIWRWSDNPFRSEQNTARADFVEKNINIGLGFNLNKIFDAIDEPV